MNFDNNLDPNQKLLYDHLGVFPYADILAPEIFMDAVMGCARPKYFKLKL